MSQEASTEHQALVSELQGWHRAKDQATRYNRNLLQYAAAIAAVFGIGAGGGGIIAVAGALSQIDEGSQSVADWAEALAKVRADRLGGAERFDAWVEHLKRQPKL